MRGGQCHAAGARRTTPREIPPLVSLTTYRACSLLGGGASQELQFISLFLIEDKPGTLPADFVYKK